MAKQPTAGKDRTRKPTKLNPLLSALAGSGLVFLCANATAATYTVSNPNDSGDGSLRQVIEIANANPGLDHVQFSLPYPATIALGSGQIEVTDPITLTGPGDNRVIISGSNNNRIFDVVDPADDNNLVTLTLEGLTLRDGRVVGENGGCIRSENLSHEGLVVLTNSIVTSCSAIAVQGEVGILGGMGGGIFSNGAGPDKYSTPSVLATRSTISGNSATANGGGMFGYFSSLEASVVSGNTVTGGTFDLDDTKYGVGGGGVTAYLATVNDSTISGNSAMGMSDAGGAGSLSLGGGIAAGLAIVQNSTISGNTATAATTSGTGAELALAIGGGAFVTPKYGLNITNSTITGNIVSGSTAPGVTNYLYGAGIGLLGGGSGGGLVKNQATEGHSAMPALAAKMLDRITARSGSLPVQPSAPGDLILNSTIVANSTGSVDIGCTAFGPGCSYTIAGANNLVETVGTGITLPGDTLTLDPMLAGLADNGGPVAGAVGGADTGHPRTHGLTQTSPARNTGNNIYDFEFDQRGPGYPRVKSGQADIGAFEGLAPAQPVPGLNPTALGLLSGLLAILGWRRRPR